MTRAAASPRSTGPIHEPESHFYSAMGLRLHYAAWGQPDAPVLILLHGGRDHARSWDWVAAELVDRWRVIAPDLRGHGDSDWASGGSYPFSAAVFDLAELVRHLGVPQVDIVAHSKGGHIALRYAGLYPERVSRLLAIEGLGRPEAQTFTDPPAVAARFRGWLDGMATLAAKPERPFASLDDAAARMVELNPRLSRERARHLVLHGMRRRPDGLYVSKFDPLIRLHDPADISGADLEHIWGQIACPVVLAYGRQSWTRYPDEESAARHFRNVQVLGFDGSGHWVHHDQFEKFVSAARVFLERR